MKKSLLICILAVLLCVSVLFAACAPGLEAETLENMQEFLKQMYQDDNPTDSYTVTGLVAAGKDKASIKWSVTITEGDQNAVKVGAYNEETKQYTIEVDPEPKADVKYTLTATLTNDKGVAYKVDGKDVTVSFERSLKAYAVNSFAEYVAAENDASLVVQGVVVAVLTKANGDSVNGLYIVDNDGGYYIYDVATLPEGIKVGDTVVAKGKKDNYNGTLELKEATVTIKDATTSAPAPKDFTDLYKAAAAKNDLKDPALVGPQAQFVTIKGVTLKEQGGDKGDYLYFELDGLKSYIRISSSVCPLNAADTESFTTKFLANYGKKADITGVICVYSGNFYLTPVDLNSISNIVEISYTDAEKVAMDKDNIKISANASEGDEIELPATGALGTTITWAFAEGKSYEGLATLADGKLTITGTPDETTRIELVATITSGEASDTKNFEVKVYGAVIDWKVTADALETCDALEDGATSEDFYYFYGTVGEIYNTEYCNFYLLDAEGNSIVVYGLYAPNGTDRYGSKRQIAEIPFKEGDLICMRAQVQRYVKNGSITPELVNAVHVETPAKGTEVFVAYNATEAVAICDALENGATTEDFFYFSGVVGEIYNTEYCNFYLTDANGGSIVVYGLYAPNGTDRYGSKRQIAEIPFKEGDLICMRAQVQKYVKNDNITPELVNAVLVSFSAPSVPVHTCESKCAVCGGCEDAACTEEACTTKCNCVAQDAPEAGTYVLKLVHTNLENKALYFTGAMDGHYFATTEVEAEAIQVVLAKLENGKYTMAITVEGATKYLAIVKSGTYINVVMQDAAAEWTWNAKLGNFTIDVDGTAYFYGTSSTGTYTTISQRKLSDASTTCQAKLVALSGGSTGGETPAECTNLCETCGKCLDKDCTQHAEKCEGHTITTIAGALAAADGAAVELTGTVTGHNGGFKSNFYIEDEAGNSIYVYYATSDVNIGDVVKVVGKVGSYNGAKQIAKGSTVTIVTPHTCVWADATCEKPAKCTICGVEKGEALGHTYVEGVCSVCGEAEPAAGTYSYSYTFESKVFSANATLALGDKNWTLAGDGEYWGFDNNNGKGQQFGSGSKPYKSMTLTSESFSNVTEIVIKTSGAKDIAATLKVYVGSTLVDTITLTTTATEYTIEVENLTGEVKFEYTQTSSKAIYINYITVNGALAE